MKNFISFVIFFSLSLILPTRGSAQQPDSLKAQHFVGLQLGINQVKEENLHPKASGGILAQFSYGFENQNKNLERFDVVLGYSRLKTELEDLSKTVNLRFRTAYSLNFKCVENKKFIYHLGPEAVLDYNASFYPNWDDSHLYWADYLSVGVNNIMTVPISGNRQWVTTIAIPLFSVFSRPEIYRLYKIDETDAGGIISNLNSNIDAAHLTNVFHLRLLTEYRFPAFRNGHEALSYSFEWIKVKNDDGFAFQKITHQVGIKFFL
ncbi:MAG TPA: hypothetical protein VFF90_02590 [Saprospiraceae bacterium]|nr:hypothetical protein [Saprospiraceae bacterium]